MAGRARCSILELRRNTRSRVEVRALGCASLGFRTPFAVLMVLLLPTLLLFESPGEAVESPSLSRQGVDKAWVEVEEAVDGYDNRPRVLEGSAPAPLEALLSGAHLIAEPKAPRGKADAGTAVRACQVAGLQLIDVFPAPGTKSILLEVPSLGYRRIYSFSGDTNLVSAVLPSECFRLGPHHFIRSRIQIAGSGAIVNSVLFLVSPDGSARFFDERSTVREALDRFQEWKVWTKGGDFAKGRLIYEKLARREDYSRSGVLRLHFEIRSDRLEFTKYEVVDEDTRAPDSFGLLPPPPLPGKASSD